ncbi:MAG: hypothetical protein JWN67_673 [Actinomycetia bacterium]|nr:hypothetical protein [Actinomycetes bacterium]
MAPSDTPMVPVKGQAGLAITLTLAIAAIGLLFLIVSAFSQDNVSTSVDGKQAVHSHNLAGH